MKRNIMIKLALPAVFLIIMACGTATPEPTADAGAYAAQTIAAYTAQAMLTQAGSNPTNIIPTDQPPAQPIPTPTFSETAPEPLPVTHTGVTLYVGECFDFDTGAVTAPDTSCDVLLTEAALLQQMNLTQISGYVTMTVPTRSDCAAARFEAGDLAVQTDLYYCFATNGGNIGFIVARDYLSGTSGQGIVFDYWIFH